MFSSPVPNPSLKVLCLFCSLGPVTQALTSQSEPLADLPVRWEGSFRFSCAVFGFVYLTQKWRILEWPLSHLLSITWVGDPQRRVETAYSGAARLWRLFYYLFKLFPSKTPIHHLSWVW